MKHDPNIYLSDNFVVVDLETAHYGMPDPSAVNPKARCLVASWRTPEGKYKYQWGSEIELQELYDDIEQADYVVAHRAAFELGYFQRAGVDISKFVVADTNIAEYVILGNQSKGPQDLTLAECMKRHGLGRRRTKWIGRLVHAGVCPSTLPRKALLSYNLEDVEQEYKVWIRQRQVMIDNGLLPVFYTRCYATPVLTAVEFAGMHVDKEAVLAEWGKQFDKVQDLELQLGQLTGGINFKSGPQVAKFLYEDLGFEQLKKKVRGQGWIPRTTPTGRPLTDSDTINELKPVTKEQKQFKSCITEVRKAQTYLSKILNPLKRLVDETEDHVLYASFNQTIARTHRLSSSGKPPYNLQFQNFPRSYKYFFTARRPGWRVVVADYSQLEFNVAAFLAQCPVAIRDVKESLDVHRQSATIMDMAATQGEKALAAVDKMTREGWKAKIMEMDKKDPRRQDAKPDTFGPLYGKMSGTPAQVAYFDWFRKHYTGVEKVMKGWINEALSTKQTVMQTGLKFYWPGCRAMADGYVANSTNIRNYPIQNFASAEITLPALRMLWEVLVEQKWEARIVSTVHDSIVLEVPEDEVDGLKELLHECMVKGVYEYLAEVYGIDYNLPLKIDVTVGDCWV